MSAFPHRRPRGTIVAALLALSMCAGIAGLPDIARAQMQPTAQGQIGVSRPAIPPAAIPAAPNAPATVAPVPVAPAPTDAAAAMPSVGIGLCQCIADRAERRFECLGSPAVCQSACGSTHYAFVPYANFTCPLTAQQQPVPTPMQAQPPRTP